MTSKPMASGAPTGSGPSALTSDGGSVSAKKRASASASRGLSSPGRRDQQLRVSSLPPRRTVQGSRQRAGAAARSGQAAVEPERRRVASSSTPPAASSPAAAQADSPVCEPV